MVERIENENAQGARRGGVVRRLLRGLFRLAWRAALTLAIGAGRADARREGRHPVSRP